MQFRGRVWPGLPVIFMFEFLFSPFILQVLWKKSSGLKTTLFHLLESILSIVNKIRTNQVTRPSDAVQIWIWSRSLIEAGAHVRGQRVCAIERDVLQSKVQFFCCKQQQQWFVCNIQCPAHLSAVLPIPWVVLTSKIIQSILVTDRPSHLHFEGM